MTAPSPATSFLDDSQLLRIAETPRARLFPILNRASAFSPLIVVFCVLPAFQLLSTPVPNEEASMWGLRSLAVANATTFTEYIQPGLNEPGQPLIGQPPLSAWLNGAIIRILGPLHPLVSSFVALVATAIAIWLTTRLAWRIGGANTALISALLTCSHPQILDLAIEPSGEPIGFLLMMASVFGLQRHLEGKFPKVSLTLVISGITWGLSILAVGPIAFAVPVTFALHALYQRNIDALNLESVSFQSRLMQAWPVLRSMLIFVGIGFVASGWWEVAMLWEYGFVFWRSWWTTLPFECLAQQNNEWQCDLRLLIQPTWQEWLNQQALLMGWLIVGLERSFHEWCRPTSERVRRRFQLLLLWWIVAFIGRVLAEISSHFFVTNTMVWNLALLAPTILLSALGIGTLIERAVSRRGEFFLVVLLVCLTVFRITSSWLFGVACGALAATILICGPRFVSSTGRNENSWSEVDWRRLLCITVYGSLFACVSLGLSQRSQRTSDESRLAELRDRLSGFPEVRRISLISTRDPMPITLRYLLRCRWPKVELVKSDGWDSGLTQAMNEESSKPHSRFLILEWTQRDIKLPIDTGQGWQVKSVGDPIRFHGRRLSLVLIEPQT